MRKLIGIPALLAAALAGCSQAPASNAVRSGAFFPSRPPPLRSAEEIQRWTSRCSSRIAECEGDIFYRAGGEISRIESGNLLETRPYLFIQAERHADGIIGIAPMRTSSAEAYGIASRDYYERQ